jgi:hypothetical protein
MIEMLIILSLPYGIVGWYLILSDPTDNRTVYKKFHSLMKSSRINKIYNKLY